MELFPEHEFFKEPMDRWRRVAGFVHTKTIDECREQADLQKAIELSAKEGKVYVKPKKVEKKVEEVKKEQTEGEGEEDYGELQHVIGSSNTVDAAKAALKNSAKTLVKIDDVQMLGAALAAFEGLKLPCMCVVCGLPFDAVLRILDTKNRLMNYSRPCFKCRSKIIIICNYSLVHEGNLFDAGCLVSVNAKCLDIAVVNFNITCGD